MTGLAVKFIWIQIPTLPFMSYVTLGKSVNLFAP